MAALGDNIKANHRRILMQNHPPKAAKQAYAEQTLQRKESSRHKNDDAASPQGPHGLEQRATLEAASESNDTGEKTNRACNSGVDLNPGASTSVSVDKTNSATNVEAKTEGRCFYCSNPIPWSGLCRLMCGHSYCNVCLIAKFERTVIHNPHRHYPPNCCRKEILLDQRVSQRLPLDLIHRYLNKESDVNTTSNRTYHCHVAKCRSYIPPRSINGWRGTCPSCGKITCAACKKENHGIAREVRPEEWQDFRNYSLNKWRRCGFCERLVERSSTCCSFMGW